MAEIVFRDYLPYHKNVVATPVVITDDTPTWTTINQLVISDTLPAGEYVITLNWTWQMADVNDSAYFRLVSPLTSGQTHIYEPRDANDVSVRTAATPVTHAGGAVTLTFEGSKTVGAQDLTIDESSIEFERKA